MIERFPAPPQSSFIFAMSPDRLLEQSITAALFANDALFGASNVQSAFT